MLLDFVPLVPFVLLVLLVLPTVVVVVALWRLGEFEHAASIAPAASTATSPQAFRHPTDALLSDQALMSSGTFVGGLKGPG